LSALICSEVLAQIGHYEDPSKEMRVRDGTDSPKADVGSLDRARLGQEP
jgi:hypothetical protein